MYACMCVGAYVFDVIEELSLCKLKMEYFKKDKGMITECQPSLCAVWLNSARQMLFCR